MDWCNPHPLNQERLNCVWPKHLAGLLNATDTINLSLGCSSNERIVRTTMDYIANEIVSGRSVDNILAVIQWTHLHRFEYWDEQNKCWVLAMPASVITSKKLNFQESLSLNKFKDIVYANFSDETYVQRFWTQVVALASFLDKHKISYWFINLDTEYYKLLESWQQRYLEDNIRWIRNSQHYAINYMFNNQHSSGSGHPSKLGHQQIANNIYFYIKDKL